MEIFENLKYRLEDASTEIKFYLLTFAISLFHALLIVGTFVFATEYIEKAQLLEDSPPALKSVVVALPVPVIVQEPEAGQNDKKAPAAALSTMVPAASSREK